MIKKFKENEHYFYVWVNHEDKLVSQIRHRIYDGSFNHDLDGSFRKQNEAIKYREKYIKKGYKRLEV